MQVRVGRIVPFVVLVCALAPQAVAQSKCSRNISASVGALNQPYMLNRLGASMPSAQVFALTSDIVASNCSGAACNTPVANPATLVPGKVMLRSGKRPRPLVLRANVGDCLAITFYNYLTSAPVDPNQPATRSSSIHLAGLNWQTSSSDDGSYVGSNSSSLVAAGTTAPAPSAKYNYYAAAPGVFYLYATAANFGSPTDLQTGLFGAVVVEPAGSEWYRSQLSAADFNLAATWPTTTNGLPTVNYAALYPSGNPRAGMPVLAMLDANNNIVSSDVQAIITGPNAGSFPAGTFPPNDSLPNRQQPYREFVLVYHEVSAAVQAFPDFYNPAMSATLSISKDAFAINYGTGAIGAEILANRYGVGPMGGCADCRFEEFFLSSWTVGDPGMVVDVPANAGTGTTPCASATTGAQTNALNCAANASTCSVASPPPGCAPLQCPSTAAQYPQCTFDQGTTANGYMTPKRKATRALYPDDPASVYHAYLNDHTIFRVLHGGVGPTHVHHQHAHQWLHSPNNDDSAYLDSQMISPGAAYTLEMAFNGAGNRNKTVGDSIFHCHFYPHFAGGMWGLWRVHDTFEAGTSLDSTGTPQSGSRALPDGEIAAGTPIPAVVPLPTLAMAPMPAAVQIVPVTNPDTNNVAGYQVQIASGDLRNPGFPFYIPGIAGIRAPHPPLDFAVDTTNPSSPVTLNGGLPRHLIISAQITNAQPTPTDFSKDNTNINAFQLPESGTVAELAAMAFHAVCTHSTFTPSGAAGLFRTNGLAPVSGAPFANPALDPSTEGPDHNAICKNNLAQQLPLANIRRYKGAAFETNIVFNKSGWHFPQSRMVALWQDVLPTYNGARLGTYSAGPTRAPEPIFFRVNSGDAVDYWHTNLVPDYYQLDDFQVKTPTDIIGQHIHLVKFDITSSDGAANGFNYEDGTFSPQEVQQRIQQINACGGLSANFASLAKCNSGTRTTLTAQAPPAEICGASPTGCPPEWTGAQTTVQRWMADPIENNNSVDRTLRTVFTHDHFGPSTHQQAGLYGALVVEPKGSAWAHNETGVQLGTRTDGGPTSWQAMITNVTEGQGTTAYREFLIALADFQLAYQSGSPTAVDPTNGWASPSTAINAPCTVTRTPPFNTCPSGPNPTIISSPPAPLGTATFNYRNEPLAMRLAPCTPPTQCSAQATDLGFVFASNVSRNTAYNSQPTPGASISGSTDPSSFVFPGPINSANFAGDPFTPMLRAYENDDVQVRVVAGAHVFPHSFLMNGNKWFFEPGTPPATNNTGYRNYQSVGISEHFEFLFKVPRTAPAPSDTAAANNFADYLYMTDSATKIPGLSEGMWGLLRAYRTPQTGPGTGPLQLLPSNPSVAPLPATKAAAGYSCPTGAPVRAFTVYAQPITSGVGPGSLILNNRGAGISGTGNIALPNALVYSLQQTLPTSGQLEPLILRAKAGECIQLTLNNNFGVNGASGIFKVSQTEYGTNYVPSTYAGINPQLLGYDVTTSDGMNVGFNKTQTVASTGTTNTTYYWYAGNLSISPTGTVTGTPVEFGPVNLRPADPLMQNILGLVAALVIEPADASWTLLNSSSQIGASVTSASAGNYTELVAVMQDDIFGASWSGGGVGHAVNYRNESMAYRFSPNGLTRQNVAAGTSNSLVNAAPQTQLPTVTSATTPVRLRLLHAGGGGTQQVMTLHGNVWQEEPWGNNSTVVASNPESQWFGGRDTFGPNDRFDILLPQAGGSFGISGSYLLRSMMPGDFQDGMWSVYQVGSTPSVTPPLAQADRRTLAVQPARPRRPRQPGELRPEDFHRQERSGSAPAPPPQ